MSSTAVCALRTALPKSISTSTPEAHQHLENICNVDCICAQLLVILTCAGSYRDGKIGSGHL